MEITDVRLSGGYQGEREHEDAVKTLSLIREFPRCMYPGEFVSLLQKFKHPRVSSIGVESNRWGARMREEAGFGPQGTVWVADSYEKDNLFVIPCNVIPYSSIKTKTWNESTTRWSEEGELARGWRTALATLVKSGHLNSHSDLSFLIGEDTFKLLPKELRV